MIHFKALEAHLKNNKSLPVNIKLIIEGEEEIGSVNLESFILAHKELLKADAVVISDTAMYDKDNPAIGYALRGLCYMQVEITGPNRDLHSGHFGGAVENPINALANIITLLKDEKEMKDLLQRLKKEFPDLSEEIKFDEEHQSRRIELTRAGLTLTLDENFFASPDFKELKKIFAELKGLGHPPYKLTHNSEKREFISSRELFDFILSIAKKGITIQRYKGLGEMNPEQLWETTMNPANRILKQVSIEDAVKTDEVFDMLMGSEVPPRKRFIQSHAKFANIDI